MTNPRAGLDKHRPCPPQHIPVVPCEPSDSEPLSIETFDDRRMPCVARCPAAPLGSSTRLGPRRSQYEAGGSATGSKRPGYRAMMQGRTRADL